ncbi:hypothetical protein K0U00_41565, partial [Paenibacillus sepulcri]|nr:hypothetical protein [Paenibacillus sepulcri]
PQSVVEVFISSVEPLRPETGTLLLGPVEMNYQPGAFELEIDPQTAKGLNGEERVFYRILLTAIRPDLHVESEVRFKWRV